MKLFQISLIGAAVSGLFSTSVWSQSLVDLYNMAKGYDATFQSASTSDVDIVRAIDAPSVVVEAGPAELDEAVDALVAQLAALKQLAMPSRLSAQSAWLREELQGDADWAELIDQLSLALRAREPWD